MISNNLKILFCVFKYARAHLKMHFKLLKTKKEKKKKALGHFFESCSEILLRNGTDLDKNRVQLSDPAPLL